MPPPPNAVQSALQREKYRLAAVLAVFLSALGYLAASLHYEQVVRAGDHADALEAHSMRRVRLPATRGRILDRRGVVLADNSPDYTLGVFVEELRRPGNWSNTVDAVDAFLDELSAVIGRPREVDRRAIERHILRRRPLALTAWSHLGPVELARFSERAGELRGADIQVRSDRVYPLGDCAAHVIGYVGRGQPEPASGEEADDEPDEFDYYLPDLIGRGGIEQALDPVLAGSPGGELVCIDAIGFKHAGSMGRAPEDGRDVVLALDAGWQREAEHLLEGRRGAIVVIDVRTGEVPVLATSPRYSLAEFLPSLSLSTWKRLLDDPERPLVNRATQGIYAPGSTLKPFVALAALDAGKTTRHRLIDCDGAFRLGPDGPLLRCGHRFGHGSIDLETAIEQSCNVYFCQIGTELGYEPALHDSLALLGFGRRPGLEIPVSPGILPTSDWKRRKHSDVWRFGDTANLSIGQGFLCVTPLQMAVATAAIANGGDVLRPRLVLAPVPAGSGDREVVAHMPWRRSSLDIVQHGMWRVVNAPHGGGRQARLDGLEIAAKTGTAEVGAGNERSKNTWMTGFAPYRSPQYAMVVFIEDGESGGKTSAPLLRRMFAAMYGLDAGDPDEAQPEYHDLPAPEEPEEAIVGDPDSWYPEFPAEPWQGGVP